MEINFMKRYQELTGADKDTILAATTMPAIRVNTLKMEEKELLRRLNTKNVKLRKIPFLQHGYEYSSKFSLGATPEYLQGFYYLQEAASQIPAIVLNPNRESKVLDMAAAPGSKTTQLAQIMENTGVIIALDESLRRLQSLANNIERCGVKNCITFKKDARFAFDLGMKFEYVLLDAPCTGNYCIEEKFFSEKSFQGVKERVKLQRELLKSARMCLKNKGMLVYSTCSLEPEENEENIKWFTEKYSDMQLIDTGLEIGEPGINLKQTRRLWPWKTKTQGFFIAKLQRVIPQD